MYINLNYLPCYIVIRLLSMDYNYIFSVAKLTQFYFFIFYLFDQAKTDYYALHVRFFHFTY